MSLITGDDIKRHLRINHDDYDHQLLNCAEDACAIIARHIKVDVATLDADTTDKDIRRAAILVGARLFEYPDGSDESGNPVEILCSAVWSLLEPHRLPTLA